MNLNNKSTFQTAHSIEAFEKLLSTTDSQVVLEHQRKKKKRYPTISEEYMRQRMSGIMSQRATQMINQLHMRDLSRVEVSQTHGLNSLASSAIEEDHNYATRASLNKTFQYTRRTCSKNDNILISDKKSTAFSPRISNTFVMGYPKLKEKPLEYQYFPYLKKPADKYSVETSIEAPKHSTEIVTHRIQMAIQRL